MIETSQNRIRPNSRSLIAPASSSQRRIIALTLAIAASASLGSLDDRQPITESVAGTTIKFDLVPIPAGKTTVADPKDPAKTIEVAIAPLYISKTEVTWDLYDIFVYRLDETDKNPDADATSHPSKPYIPPDRGFGHTGYAAIGMSFQGATEFCQWLSKKTGHTYRLATEAEWEYAARAGGPAPYGAGVDAAHLGDFAWLADNSGAKTHSVASKKPNAWGIFDMLGNAAEWVVGTDGKPVTKGGSFKDPATDLEVTDRLKQSSAWNASDPQIPKSKWWLADCTFVGFRIVREADGARPPTPSVPPPAATPPVKHDAPTPKDRLDDHPAPK